MTSRKQHPTRERILRSALLLFQRKGYHATGIAEILERAQAPKGSFYHHFPGGKEALAVATLEWLQHEVMSFLDGIADQGAAAMVTGLARYAAQGLRHPKFMRGSLLTVLAQEAIPDPPAVHAALRAYAEAIRDRLVAARVLEGAKKTQAKMFADLALALLQGASVMARIEGGAVRLEALIAEWLSTQP
jgi:TetR/AcrR family transcriptional regulator, lmrAB and yxaGH operons repressor